MTMLKDRVIDRKERFPWLAPAMAKKAKFAAERRAGHFAQPDVESVNPVDAVLTNVSIGFMNEKFLWDQIGPPAAQDRKSGTFPIWTRDFWFRRIRNAERAPEGPYTRVGYEVATSTFDAIEIGYEKVLADVIKAANTFGDDPEDVANRFVTNLIQIELEKRAAAAFFVTGVWGTSNTLTGGNQWSDFANSDPIADVDTARRTVLRNTGARINTMFLGLLAWEKLKEHPLVLDKYKHTQLAVMTPPLVAAVLDVDRLIVGDSVENTAAEGASYVGADMWTDNVLLLVKNDPALQVANGAYTWMWDERGNIPWGVETYRDEKVRSDVVRVFTHLDPQVVSAQHGYLHLDAVA